MKKLVGPTLYRCGLLLWLAGFPVAYGQQYSIATVAGGAPPPSPSVALSTSIGSPRRVAVDSGGNVYFSAGNTVFKLSGANLSVLAGNSRPGFAGDFGPATGAQLNSPAGVAVDTVGNVYIADSLNNRIRVVDSKGIISTFAGNGAPGAPGLFGDGGYAVNANLQLPLGVAVDHSGNVYIADTGNNTVRKVVGGIISTIAGDGYPGYAGDTKLASGSELNRPADVAIDSANDIYIADTSNGLVRKITVSDGLINIFAGSTTTIGYSGDAGLATSAGLIEPYALAIDSATAVYIAEREDGRIRVVDYKTLYINTIIGNGTNAFAGDGSTSNKASLNLPTGVAVDGSGNVYIADSANNRIRKATSGGGVGTITTLAGNGGVNYSGDGGLATLSQLNGPRGVAADASGNFYIADTNNNVVRKVSSTGVITTFAGNGTAGFGGDGSAAASAQLSGPQGVAVDASGNVYIADTNNARVRKVTSAGVISTVAGSGTAGFAGDGSAATSAQINLPIGLAVDSSGNLYIGDYGNNVVRKVTSGGTISTYAGSGIQGYGGDGASAVKAAFNGPQAVAVDSGGNVYIADSQNSRVRVVTPAGSISTVAGTGVSGYTGDGRLATLAQIVNPVGLAVDSSGGIYVSDSSSVVRKFFVGGAIFTVAGKGTSGYSGDGGAATSAQLNAPIGVAVDAKGNVYVGDSANNAVRQLQPSGFGSSIGAVVSSAANATGAVAPGEVIVLYGSGLGPSSVVSNTVNSSGVFGTSVGGTTVYFNGTPGPILYTSANQVGAIVPYGVTGSSLQIYVIYQNQSSAPVTVSVTSLAPAFFTLDGSGKGQATAINSADNSINGGAHPAAGGSVLTLYATGLGKTNPSGVDGLLGAVPLPQPVAAIMATIGGKSAVVQYAGGAAGIVAGVAQVNLVVPTGLTAGANAVVLTVGGVSSPAGVTIVTQ